MSPRATLEAGGAATTGPRPEADPPCEARTRSEAGPPSDTGAPSDTRPPSEASPRSDAGARSDARPPSDTRPPSEARTRSDAEARSDAGPPDAAGLVTKPGRGPLDRRLLRHARAGRRGVAVLAVLGAGQAGATLVVAFALATFVSGHRGVAAALLAGAFLARAALTRAEQVVAARTTARVRADLQSEVLRAARRRGPAWVAAFGAGRLTAVLTTGLDALGPWFGSYLPSLILGVTLPPFVVLAMAATDPRSALIAVATLPLIPLLGALVGWATEARARQRWAADARLAGHFLDVVQGLATLRAFGRAGRQTAVIAELTDQHRRATLRVLRVAFLSSTALDLVGTLSVGLIAVTAGLRVAAGDLGLTPALLVILLAPEAYRPLREMAARYHAATDATAVITDVDTILTGVPPEPTTITRPALPPVVTGRDTAMSRQSAAPAPGHGRALPPEAGLVATGLRVRYPGTTADALVLDTLTVRAGELVALAGPSGAGKTTALRTIARLQAPRAGAVQTSGDVHYLPQRVALPHARTVADLFAPGDTDAVITSALHTVDLHTQLKPSTPLGERGTGISAGQRHRLALAALLRRVSPGHHRAAASTGLANTTSPTQGTAATGTGTAPSIPMTAGPGTAGWIGRPGVLLLDEPTAHLDAETERLVIARLRQAAAGGCAVLVVAHRPALLAAADRVVTLAPAGGPGFGVPAGVPGLDAALRPHEGAGAPEDFPAVCVPAEAAPVTRPRAWFTRPSAAVALGAGSSLAGVVLTGAAAWLLVRAATLPPVLSLSTAVVLVRGSAVARPLLRYLERLVAHEVAFARLGRWRAAVYASLVPRVPGPRLRRRGDLLTRVVDDVDARVGGLLRGRLPAAAAAVALLSAVAAATWIAPLVVVPAAVGLAVAGWVAPALAARFAARSETATATARAELRDAMVEAVEGVEELGGPLDGVPEERGGRLARLQARAAARTGSAAAVAQLGWGAAVAGTALALRHADGLPAEWTAVVLLGLVALGETALSLPDAAVARHRARAGDARLAALSSGPLPATFPPDPLPDGPGRADVRGDVVVRGLTAGWDRTVLRGLDLTLAAGERVAVVGRSGSGKSTLGAVLARLLDPAAGVVTVGGRDLRELPESAVRGRIVLVGEETGHVFASTVRENLRLARPGASDAELLAVLARVRLGGWLAALPDGLDTWLGAGGGTMSGGQARRIGVARALLATPSLLILDEPTEGLDGPTAEALMADVLGASGGHTVLVLTHRTEGLGLVDRVLDLEELHRAS